MSHNDGKRWWMTCQPITEDPFLRTDFKCSQMITIKNITNFNIIIKQK